MALAIRKVSNSIQAKAKPEAQLGDSETESKEPRRVGCGKSQQVGTCGSRQLRIVNYALCIMH